MGPVKSTPSEWYWLLIGVPAGLSSKVMVVVVSARGNIRGSGRYPGKSRQNPDCDDQDTPAGVEGLHVSTLPQVNIDAIVLLSSGSRVD
jgi:hypothetical protein